MYECLSARMYVYVCANACMNVGVYVCLNVCMYVFYVCILCVLVCVKMGLHPILMIPYGCV